MNHQDAECLIEFLSRSGALKDTMRSAFTDEGAQENTAAHSWRLALWVIALEPHLDGYDTGCMLRMAILHDLGEAITGDVPAIFQSGDQTDRQNAEWAAVEDLVQNLTPSERENVLGPVRSYNDAESKEAQLVKALDKLETLLQHATGRNPDNFDYAFNLTYGENWTSRHPLAAILRKIIDQKTRARLDQQAGLSAKSHQP